MSVGKKLRGLLEERNMTQKDFAHELNIAPSTIGGYIQEKSEPDYDTLKLFATYFDVTTDYLLDYSKVSEDEDNRGLNELIRIFNCLSPEQKELYLEQGKAFLKVNLKRNAKSLKSISRLNNKTTG